MNKVKYIAKQNVNSIRELVEKQTGLTAEEFLNPEPFPYIHNLKEAVETVKNFEGPIMVVGDYDCDGIMATYILCTGLQKAGKSVVYRVPLRFSEGYGLSDTIIEQAQMYFDSIGEPGMIITCDNGISAHSAIKLAKSYGMTVVVTDHHLAVTDEETDERIYPDADIIVDPCAEDISPYKLYCGAGIAYRFIKEMLSEDVDITNEMICAGIATVADVMDIIGANWLLVKNALFALNHGKGPKLIRDLMDELSKSHLDESDFGFTLGPHINAISRLHDEGAMQTLHAMFTNNEYFARYMVAERRKVRARRDKAQEIADSMITTRPIVVNIPDAGEGIIGLIAGYMTEKYQCPSICFTPMEDGYLKGSGRSTPLVHMKHVLDKVNAQGLIVKYGGHSGAAGLTIKETDLTAFTNAFIEACGEIPPIDENQYYDISLKGHEVISIAKELEEFAPFGNGNPAPVFRYQTTLYDEEDIQVLGAQELHFKLTTGYVDLMGFFMYPDFKETMPTTYPYTVESIGELGQSWYKGKASWQIKMKHFQKLN